MDIVCGARGSGKTTMLIAMSAQSGDYIITQNQETARRIALVAKNMGVDIPFPLTYDELMEKRYYGQHISGFLIDDLEQFVNWFTQSTVPIHAASLTPEKILYLRVNEENKNVVGGLGD